MIVGSFTGWMISLSVENEPTWKRVERMRGSTPQSNMYALYVYMRILYFVRLLPVINSIARVGSGAINDDDSP